MGKFKLYLIAISGLCFSCSQNEQLNKENDELKREISQLKDSINQLTENEDPKYLVDILAIDTSKGPLGNLRGDTLVLDAYFSECGEFGGNREWIKIFHKSGKTTCIIIRDSADCENYDYKTRYTRIDSSVHDLNRSDEFLILEYLNDLTKLAFAEQEPLTNALNTYTAKIESTNPYRSITRFYLEADDWSFGWFEFIKLRMKLKN